MYSNIKQFRARGVRRSDRDIANDPGLSGAVHLHHVGGFLRLSAVEWGCNRAGAELFPDLWDAKCVGWNAAGMVWQGFQHARLSDKKGDPVYFQEWRIEVIGMRPPDDKIKSVFHGYESEMPPPDHSPAAAADQVPTTP